VLVLSLFDGIGTARLALERAGLAVEKYYSSEIDKYASAVTRYHYPDTIELGDITLITKEMLPEKIDLIIGGSPCTNLSCSGDRKGLKGEQSKLFFEFVRLVKEIRPKYFILENVASMKKEWQEIMSNELFGIKPVMINAALVSAQQRKRLFWVGKLNDKGEYEQVEIKQPEDRHIYLKDILESGIGVKASNYAKNISEPIDKSLCLMSRDYKGFGHQCMNGVIEREKSQTILATIYKENTKSMVKRNKTGLIVIDKPKSCAMRGRYQKDNSIKQNVEVRKDDKTNSLTTVQKDSLILQRGEIRKLTPLECERLQSLDDNWTKYGKLDGKEIEISNTQRYKQCGNGFNCEVVKEILYQVFDKER